jgi:hypothetical protein
MLHIHYVAEVSIEHEKDARRTKEELDEMTKLNRELVMEVIRLKTALHMQTTEMELLKKKLAVYDSL